MKSQARAISTNQVEIHEDLPELVARHNQHEFRRPIAKHTLHAFDGMLDWLADWKGDLIIDACCGVGESTAKIAQEHLSAKVIGIDKSIARLHKHHSYLHADPNLNSNNYTLVQADLSDFWRLLVNYIEVKKPKWRVVKQFILYPNPYPKKSQVGKRWHASALFPFIVKLSTNMEVRSNWRLYLQEYLVAARLFGLSGEIIEHKGEVMTPFERKYLDAGQQCYILRIYEPS